MLPENIIEVQSIPSPLADGNFELVNFEVPTAYFTLINTAIVFIGFRFLLWKKVAAMLDKRKEIISADISAAKSAKERAERAEKDYISKISSSKDEARRIIEDARKTADKKAAEIMETAREQAKSTVEKGILDAEKQRKAAVNTLKNQIGELVITAASAVASREISAENNADLIDEVLAKAEIA